MINCQKQNKTKPQASAWRISWIGKSVLAGGKVGSTVINPGKEM